MGEVVAGLKATTEATIAKVKEHLFLTHTSSKVILLVLGDSYVSKAPEIGPQIEFLLLTVFSIFRLPQRTISLSTGSRVLPFSVAE